MTAFARENQSDIVIGRYAGHRRGVAKALFNKTYLKATLATAPVIDSLTPHKMFRRQFLLDHGLRFPEGRRRLEDHVFVVNAYFRAERISILSDYHCYFHIGCDDAGNAGYQQINPAGYYGNVREVVEIMLANTEPGPLRDTCLRRTLRTELLGRLGGNTFLKQDVGYRRAVFDQARQIAEESMPLSVDAQLPAPQHVRAFLLRENRLEDLESYVAQDLKFKASARLLDLRWNDSDELVIDVEGGLVDRATGAPWSYARDEAGVYLPRPADLRGSFPRDVVDCSDRLRSSRMEIVLRRREDSEEWRIPTQSSFTVEERPQTAALSYRASARVNPLTIGGGRPLTQGTWDVYAVISQAGWSGQARLGSVRSDAASAGRRSAVLNKTVVVLYWTKPHDNLSLEMAADAGRLSGQVAPLPGSVLLDRREDGAVTMQLTLSLHTSATTVIGVHAQLTGSGSAIEASVRATRSAAGDVVLSLDLPQLTPGKWGVQVTLELDGQAAPKPIRTSLFVSAEGTVTVGPEPVVPRSPAPRSRWTDVALTLIRRAARRARRTARRAVRRARRAVRRHLR